MDAPERVRMLVTMSLGGRPLDEGRKYGDEWIDANDRLNLINGGWAEPVDEEPKAPPAPEGGIVYTHEPLLENEGAAEAVVPLPKGFQIETPDGRRGKKK